MASPLVPLIGQLAWNVRRGVGSFLTMEFGAPHLSVREPIEARHTTNENIRASLRRRRVFVAGDWHLWIEHADWKLTTVSGVLDSDDDIATPKDECLHDLEGQRLLSVNVDPAINRWTLEFDLGTILQMWPASYESEDVWSLHPKEGAIVACQKDGTFVYEKVPPRVWVNSFMRAITDARH